MREIVINDKGQAVAPQSQPIIKQDFLSDHKTRIYWLGELESWFIVIRPIS